MCTNGRYTERGIKARHGYASERYRSHPEYLVPADPALGIRGVLLEPASVVAKAWDHIEKIGARAAWAPGTVLITGAGTIGLLAALLSIQRGYQTYVVDQVTDGLKPRIVRELGRLISTLATWVKRPRKRTSSSLDRRSRFPRYNLVKMPW